LGISSQSSSFGFSGTIIGVVLEASAAYNAAREEETGVVTGLDSSFATSGAFTSFDSSTFGL
jgi:hypothetical protein